VPNCKHRCCKWLHTGEQRGGHESDTTRFGAIRLPVFVFKPSFSWQIMMKINELAPLFPKRADMAEKPPCYGKMAPISSAYHASDPLHEQRT
jgi:hypothetical protein